MKRTKPTARILAVGMMPPPFGGQALMFAWTIEYLAKKFDVDVMDIQAQTNLGQSGRMSMGKLWVFITIFIKCFSIILSFKKYDFLYYCPSGPSRFGLLKDLAILTLLRWRVHKVILHFHATGGVAYLLRMGGVIVWWARKVMFEPDLAVRCANVEPNDARLSDALEEVIVFNGIPDPGGVRQWVETDTKLHFCFMAALTEEKGIYDLLEIVCEFHKRTGRDFVLDVIGQGVDHEIMKFDALVAERGLQRFVVRHGVLLGDDKFNVMRQAKVFIFPTYFRAETQPLVLIEAAALGIPVLASDWRGINSIVVDGITGFLCPARDIECFASKLQSLIEDPCLAEKGIAARDHFVKNFSQQIFLNKINSAFEKML